MERRLKREKRMAERMNQMAEIEEAAKGGEKRNGMAKEGGVSRKKLPILLPLSLLLMSRCPSRFGQTDGEGEPPNCWAGGIAGVGPIFPI